MTKQAQERGGASRKQDGERGKRLSLLVLTGFMGAGKSTVGPLLAEALGWRFLDLDSVIEAAHRKSVPDIFRDHGEAFFRQREHEALASLGAEHQLVLALGGGALEHPDALPSLLNQEETCLVFLDAPLAELLARIQEKDRSKPGSMNPEPAHSGLTGRTTKDTTEHPEQIRPLLADPERLEARHRSRLAGYRAAQITAVTTGLRPEEVAARILKEVRARWRIGSKPGNSYGKLL